MQAGVGACAAAQAPLPCSERPHWGGRHADRHDPRSSAGPAQRFPLHGFHRVGIQSPPGGGAQGEAVDAILRFAGREGATCLEHSDFFVAIHLVYLAFQQRTLLQVSMLTALSRSFNKFQQLLPPHSTFAHASNRKCCPLLALRISWQRRVPSDQIECSSGTSETRQQWDMLGTVAAPGAAGG